jgi:hypothetical protein
MSIEIETLNAQSNDRTTQERSVYGDPHRDLESSDRVLDLDYCSDQVTEFSEE